MRDIARELGCSRTAVANAVLRLGRQAMGMHLDLIAGLQCSGRLSFDGLLSAVCSRDYQVQINTLGDSETQMLLLLTHCITHRGGTLTARQRKRIDERRSVWQPQKGSLRESISELVNELPRFSHGSRIHIDTDEHPLYSRLIEADLALGWFQRANLLSIRRTPGSAARTVDNPLFLMNYIDRMIRHRMKEHTRESIVLARNSCMQMHRMWIFAWDHNARQPLRVANPQSPSRARIAGVSESRLIGLHREFFSRRHSLRGLPVPHPIRSVWTASLPTPLIRRPPAQKHSGPTIPAYALLDLTFADPHAP